MNWRMCEPELAAPQVQALHVEAAEPRPQLGLGGEVGVGDRLLRRASACSTASTRPVNHSPVVISSGSSKPGSTASTMRPGRRQRLDRGGDGRGDLGVDVGVPERRREGDAQPGDPVVEPGREVACRPAAATSSPGRRAA